MVLFEGSPHSVLVEEYKHPAVYGSAIEYAVENGQQASIIFDPNKQTGGLMVRILCTFMMNFIVKVKESIQ